MKTIYTFAIALCLVCQSALAFDPFTISDIRVEGLQRITAGTIFSYLPVETGDRLNKDRAQESIRALFRTGFFDDVVIERDGDIMVIKVVERPAIAEIDIDGNKDIKTEDLQRALSEFGMSEGEVYQRITLDRMQQSLTREYNNRGKYNVTIDANVEELQRNRVKIDINIDEGDAAKIRHINVVGNKIFTDEEILEDFESSTTNWLSWYSRDDQYSREKLQGDLEALQSFYQDRGYIDFEIESTQVTISPDKQEIFITANIREGEVYTVNDVTLTGEFPIDADLLEQLVILKDGDTFSRRLLEASTENITGALANTGYAFAEVTPSPSVNEEERTVDLNLFVDPGQRVYVRRINFIGNEKTRDEVLRREMRQFEGGWFSQVSVDRSRVRLQRLSFIDDISIETPRVPGTDDQVDVNVSVQERTAGSFTFGLGFSQTTGLLGSLSVTQENFLGTGRQVSMSLNNSAFFKRFDLAYVDPYWTDDGVSRGLNFSIRELDQAEANIAGYLADTASLSMSFGIPITEVSRLQAQIGVNDTEIRSVAFDELNAELAAFGLLEPCIPFNAMENPDPNCPTTGFKSRESATNYSTTLLWSRDSRNRFFNPSRGSTQRLTTEITLPGSSIEFYKLFYTGTKYIPLSKSLTLSLGGELGYGDTYGDDSDVETGLPFFEHFFGGGVRSVRGYEDNTLGPRIGDFLIVDPDTGEETRNIGSPIGGDLKVTGSAELIFPIPFVEAANTTRLSWFVDVGQIYDDLDAFEADDLRYTTGLALRWQAPIGPIIINVAFPLNDEDGDETETIQFAFGNLF